MFSRDYYTESWKIIKALLQTQIFNSFFLELFLGSLETCENWPYTTCAASSDSDENAVEEVTFFGRLLMTLSVNICHFVDIFINFINNYSIYFFTLIIDDNEIVPIEKTRRDKVGKRQLIIIYGKIKLN